MCSGHGTCISGQCLCKPGWAGPLCEIPKSQCPEQCHGHGVYSADTGLCTCEPNWMGPDCSTGQCSLLLHVSFTFIHPLIPFSSLPFLIALLLHVFISSSVLFRTFLFPFLIFLASSFLLLSFALITFTFARFSFVSLLLPFPSSSFHVSSFSSFFHLLPFSLYSCLGLLFLIPCVFLVLLSCCFTFFSSLPLPSSSFPLLLLFSLSCPLPVVCSHPFCILSFFFPFIVFSASLLFCIPPHCLVRLLSYFLPLSTFSFHLVSISFHILFSAPLFFFSFSSFPVPLFLVLHLFSYNTNYRTVGTLCKT